VTAGAAFGVRDELPPPAIAAELARRVAPLRAAGLGVYVENIATDFYAAYHRWQPGRSLTWLFDAAHARHQADKADLAAFLRQPGLSDPAALAPIAARLRAHVQALGSAPLYYDLGDETGIADLTAAWDFDLAPASLAAMRVWLRTQYGALDALNREWGTQFATWDAVRPMTTDAALRVTDGNFAAWADFKAWMDVAFARALRAGTDAVHQADPAARAGLEGAQVPGWGGYDYTLLAAAVDVMEVTGAESAQPIAQALNPALVTLTTTSGAEPHALHDLWRAALAGSRGVVLWDPDGEIAGADGTPGPAGRALAGFFADMGGPLGTRLLAATPHTDAVAVLYSPASFRTRWLLDRQDDAAAGKDWAARFSETELEDNAWRQAMRQASDGLAHLGLQPRWLSPAMLAAGGLRAGVGAGGGAGVRALILPHALALSDDEAAAIRAFAAGGGTVLADIPPGAFDSHSRRRPEPPLLGAPWLGAPWLGAITLLPGLPRPALGAALAAAGVAPDFSLLRPDGAPAGDVTMQVLQDGRTTILGLLRDDVTAGDATTAGGRAETLTLRLPRPLWVRDLRLGDPAIYTDRVALRLDAARASLLTISALPGD
jgi:Beta-galactosidase